MKFKEQEIYSGYDSYLSLESILNKLNCKKPLLVCDGAYDFLFIKKYIDGLSNSFVFFNDFTPNPLYEDIVKGVDLFRRENCDIIVSIGGGSAIDVAKCIKLYAKMKDDEVYLKQEYSDSQILHIAIPTTAGTGSESTRFAVCYYNGEKQSVTHESIIPDYVILEPAFLETLPEYQKKATLLDALCQSIESLWSVNSSEESMELSKEAIKMILANIDPYFNNNKDALKNISIAANIAGRAINITQTTAAHAMSYKVTSMYKLAHGHAAAVCLPYVWRYMIENIEKCSDPRGAEHLDRCFSILDELFYVDEHRQSVYRFFRLLKLLNMDFPKLNAPEELELLVSSVNPVRLGNNPIALTPEAIREIYKNVFEIGNNYKEKNILKFLKKYNTLYEVRELQDITFGILKKVDEVCKKHNIKYFLSEGTLLGSARHSDFIPWDDDVDICMLKEDYQRFISLAQAELGADYLLDCFETNPKHWTICAKVILKDNEKFSIKRLEGIALSTAPSIDIFALEDAPASQKTLKSIGNKLKAYRVMLWLKSGYSHDYGSLKWMLLKLCSLFYSLKRLHKNIQALISSGAEPDSKLVVNYGSLYPVEKECFNKQDFSSQALLDFHGEKFPVPQNYQEILTKIYGDYSVLPKNSRRLPKHSYFVDYSK